jgi:hypothetical protein
VLLQQRREPLGACQPGSKNLGRRAYDVLHPSPRFT